MGKEEVKRTLRSLCMSHGWSYGVFWRFDPRNHMISTMEEAYFEEHAGSVVDAMLMQVHMLGEGVIGEAALNGKHRWMFVDPSTEKFQVLDRSTMQVSSWDEPELSLQISSGIKTVAVVPVEFRGVVQFGSTNEIFETWEFLDQARTSLQDNHNFLSAGPRGSISSTLKSDATGQDGLFASLNSSHNSFCGDVSTSWTDTFENMGGCSVFGSLDTPLRPYDDKCRDQSAYGELVIDPSFGSLVKDGEDIFKEFEGAHCLPSIFNTWQTDDLTQCLADSSKLCLTGLGAMVSDDMSNALGVDAEASAPVGKDIVSSIQGNLQASSQSNALVLCGEGRPLVVNENNDELLAEFGIDIGCGKLEETLKDVINMFEDTHNLVPNDAVISLSDCISEVERHPATAPRKGLFSELGLEHLLKDGKSTSSSSSTKSCIDDQWPASKKRRIEAYQMINNQIQHNGQPCRVESMQPTSNCGQMQDFGPKGCMQKSQAGLWINDSYSTDVKSCISTVNSQIRKQEEPAKSSKKRARPGESTRPRPKDRQMIADRLKELRDIIPNGGKLSIDALLGRTVKHMLFLQNLSKHADKLKNLDETKSIGQSKGLIQKGGSRNATWAYEVGGSNLFCPIIVEDLDHPGQMLIEMLCEERGYFLEIADIVRGFGLTILKGVMEERKDKIWAHFIVEGGRHVTRMDVFVSLMQLLHGTTTSELNITGEPAQVVNNMASLWGNYQQHVVPLQI